MRNAGSRAVMRWALARTERSSKHRARLLAVCGLLALAACHDLPALGTCGNGIAEHALGEACDDGGASATCNAKCELLCTDSAVTAPYVAVGTRDNTAVYCPDASYRCGLDGVCRAPSGSFERLAAPLPFDINGPPVLGDVDNDGLPDLVGTSTTNLFVRFSSATGTPLGDVVVQGAPFSEAPYAIFELPADRPDRSLRSGTMIAIPTEGFALLRSDGERFTPELDLPFMVDNPNIDDVQGLVVRDPDPTIGDAVIAVQSKSADASIAVVRVPVGQPPIPGMLLPPCVGTANQAWHTVDIKADSDRRSFVIVTQGDGPVPSAQPWHVCRYTQNGNGWALADFELGPPSPSSIALANVDDDACFELVVHSDGAPELSMIDAADPACGFIPAIAPLPIDGPGSTLLAAGQIVPDGVDEIVLTNGVYRSCTGPADCSGLPTGTFVRIAGPTPPSLWSAAAVVDLNGDHVLDVVAGRSRMTPTDPMPEREPDVDIIRGGAIPNVYRVNTSEPVTSLVAGDFDGDRLGDVAMIESAPPGDRVTVLFGTQEATVGTPIAMSSFGGRLRIDRVTEIHWLPSTRGSDGIDDLLVLKAASPGTPGTPTMPPMLEMPPTAGLLIGDAARLMTTPRFPPTITTIRPLGPVAAGWFRSDSQIQTDFQILTLTDNQAQLYNLRTNMWAPANLGMLALDQPVGALRDGPMGTRAAARGAGDHDVVVFSVGGAAPCHVTASGTLQELRGIDLDGDGVDELAVFSEQDENRTLQLFHATDCTSESVFAPELADCIDVVNAGSSLVAICRDPDSSPLGMTDPAARDLIALTNTGGRLVRTTLTTVDGDARFVTAGDYDGDGVLDVAVGVHRGSGVSVQLLRQCPAHDTRTCQ
jgi:hypothetical protein